MNLKKVKNLIIPAFVLITALIVLNHASVLAQTGETGTQSPTGETGGQSYYLPNPLGTTSFIRIINNILNYLIYISIPLLALMILIGGFQILTARDNPEKIKGGQTTIKYAVIGFVIVLCAKGVALILIQILGG
jgi:hypothetical protein